MKKIMRCLLVGLGLGAFFLLSGCAVVTTPEKAIKQWTHPGGLDAGDNPEAGLIFFKLMDYKDRVRFNAALNTGGFKDGGEITFTTTLHQGYDFEAQISSMSLETFFGCREVSMEIKKFNMNSEFFMCRDTHMNVWRVMPKGWVPTYN